MRVMQACVEEAGDDANLQDQISVKNTQFMQFKVQVEMTRKFRKILGINFKEENISKDQIVGTDGITRNGFFTLY